MNEFISSISPKVYVKNLVLLPTGTANKEKREKAEDDRKMENILGQHVLLGS